jgi:hypothetical protein
MLALRSSPVLLLVIHTWPEESEEGEPVGRIISPGKATARERKAAASSIGRSSSN